MEAIKLEVTVPKNRKLTLQLPEGVSPGNVEVLILHGEHSQKTIKSKRIQKSSKEISLQALGIDEQQATELRAKLSTFSDWDEKEMDIYDTYDAAKAKL
jgi:uncharacterized protein YjbK